MRPKPEQKKSLRGDSVALGKLSREASVIYIAFAAGGAFSLQQRFARTERLRDHNGVLHSALIVLGDVSAILHHNPLADSLRRNSRGRKSAVYLGTKRYEVELFL